MSLISKFKCSIHIIKTGLISLNFFIFFFCIFCSFFRGLYFLCKEIVACKQFCCINFANFLQRNVRGLMFKTTMYINIIARRPAGMAESLNWIEFKPFRWFSIINFKGYDFTNRIRPTTNNHHQRSQEKCRMLISGNRTYCFIFIRSFDPIPSSVPMPTKTPGIK